MSNLKKQEIIIPTRGSIQDIGPTISHKTKIVELYLKGYEYTEIERRTRHTGQSIKRYIIGFSKVVMLHSKGYNPNQIRELTNSTEKVVKEYLDLYQKYGEIREYQTENQVVLPYRGTIHDLGRAITHKKMIIGHFLKNVPTPDISRITDHTEEACDRYIKAYKNVRNLYGRMKNIKRRRKKLMTVQVMNKWGVIWRHFYCRIHNKSPRLSLFKFLTSLDFRPPAETRLNEKETADIEILSIIAEKKLKFVLNKFLSRISGSVRNYKRIYSSAADFYLEKLTFLIAKIK